MKRETYGWSGRSDSWMNVLASRTSPLEVFYVVESSSIDGERSHHLRSDLYETRSQAEIELARRRQADSGGSFSVWKSATYIEPAEWLHRVVRADGALILPRLHGLEKLTDV